MAVIPIGSILRFNGVMLVNQALVSSCGRYRLALLKTELVLQCKRTSDGAFVDLWGQTGRDFKSLSLYKDTPVFGGETKYWWLLNDGGHGVRLRGNLPYESTSEIRLQPDGNCVCYAHNPGQVVLWSTRSNQPLGERSGAHLPMDRDYVSVQAGTLVFSGEPSSGEIANLGTTPIYVTDGIQSLTMQAGGAVHALEAGTLIVEAGVGTFPDSPDAVVAPPIIVPPPGSAERAGRRFQVVVGGGPGARSLSLTYPQSPQ